jgi:hypothetical protein
MRFAEVVTRDSLMRQHSLRTSYAEMEAQVITPILFLMFIVRHTNNITF